MGKVNKGGRPKTTVEEKLVKIPLSLDKISKLYIAGWTDEQVADFIGITVLALHKWKKDAGFRIPLKSWKLIADEKVERALYERACGYRTKFKKNFVVSDGKESGSHVEIHEEEVVFAPDSTACIFWLKNRKKEEWRDRVELDHSGVINLVEKYKDLSIEQLNEKLAGFVRGSAN